MFTGIIEETGKVKSIRTGQDSAIVTVQARKVLEGTVEGDSIAVNGVCLTVTSMTGAALLRMLCRRHCAAVLSAA